MCVCVRVRVCFVLGCVCVQSSQCMWLMQALGFLLSALPDDQVLVRTQALITPHLQQLDTLVQQEVRSSPSHIQ